MKRVLIVHYHFLPVHNVGIKRLTGYLKHLPAFGWEPLVLTSEWPEDFEADASWGLSWEPDVERDLGVNIHRVPLAARPRLFTPAPDRPWPLKNLRFMGHLLFGYYPDKFIDWAKPAAKAACRLVQAFGIDAVMTYCPPETNQVVGARVARRLGVPWVPFFGDLWGFFLDGLPTLSVGATILRVTHRRWMSHASACVAVSPYMSAYLERTYQKPVEVVLTGYDPEDFPCMDSYSTHQAMVISHVGSLYPGDQRPDLFFDGLDCFLRSEPDAKSRLAVRFIGSKCEQYLARLLARRPSAGVCKIIPKVKSCEALDAVRASDALLAFNCTRFRNGHGTMSYPTKIFEGFGARKPILAIPPDGDWVDQLLEETGAGVSAADPREIAAVLTRWFATWRSSGHLRYEGRIEVLGRFTRREQTRTLARFLDSVSSRG